MGDTGFSSSNYFSGAAGISIIDLFLVSALFYLTGVSV